MFAYDSIGQNSNMLGWVVAERPTRYITVLQLFFNTRPSIVPDGDNQAQCFELVGLNSCLHDPGLTGQREAHPRKRQQEQLQHRNHSDKISYLSFNEQNAF